MRPPTRDRGAPIRSAERSAGAHELEKQFRAVGRTVDEEPPGGCLCCAAGMACDRHSLAAMVEHPAVELPMRSRMERAFRAPLGSVRAHLGERRALASLNARAAADGETVAFAAHAPAVETIAHEVVHVLQARRASGVGNAEHEAEALAVRVARGEPPAPIESRATGVQRDADFPGVDVVEYIQTFLDVFHQTLSVFEVEGNVTSAPFGRYIGQPRAFAEAIAAAVPPFQYVDDLARLVAPESLEHIVDAARRHDVKEVEGPDGEKTQVQSELGPAFYSIGVGTEIENALLRRFFESMKRMVPRYVAEALRLDPGPVHVVPLPFGLQKPKPEDLPVSHPLDHAIAVALCDPSIWVLDRIFLRDHAELIPKPRSATPVDVKLELAPDGLWHWVRATPEDATAEDVANALFGSPDQAYRLVAMPPLWGFHAADLYLMKRELLDELDQLAWHDHPTPAILNQADIAAFQASQQAHWAEYGRFNSGMPDPEREPWSVEQAPAEKIGLPRTEVDPIDELQHAANHDEYALSRVAVPVADRSRGQDDVYDLLNENVTLLHGISASLEGLGRATDVTGDRVQLLSRREQDAAACSLPSPAAAYVLAKQQNELLGRIATGLATAVSTTVTFGGVRRGVDPDGNPTFDLDPGALSDTVKEPVLECADAYVDAISAIDFPSVATPRTDHADLLAQTLSITIAEKGLHKAEPTLMEAMRTPEDRRQNAASYDPGEMEGQLNEYLGDLQGLRVRFLAKDPDAQSDLAAIQQKAGDLQFEVAVVGQLEMLDALWKAIEDEHDFWEDVGDDLDGISLQVKNAGFYRQFRDEVFDVFMQGVAEDDATKKQQAKARYGELTAPDTEFSAHFKRVMDHLDKEHHHKKWAKIIASVAIAVVAFGLGQWAGALWVAEVVGATEVGGLVVGTVVETGVGMGLNYTVLGQKPTLGGVLSGAAGNFAMLGLFNKLGRLGKVAGEAEALEQASVTITKDSVGELAKLGKAERFAAAAVKFGKQALFLQAVGLAQAEMQSLIDEHKAVSLDDLPDMIVQNLIMTVAMHIAQRPVEESITRWRHKQIGVDIEGLQAERKALNELGKELQQAPDPAKAQDLIAREQAYEAREREAMAKLANVARTRPGLFPAGEAERIVSALEAHDAAAAELVRAQALSALEEIGPSFYRADRRAVDAILSQQQQAGGRIVKVETNPVNGLRTITVQPELGGPIRIKEKLQSPAGTRAIPAAEAQRFEAWLDQEPIGRDPDRSELYRTRLRELYARDPQAAVSAGERLGYDTDHPLASPDPFATTARAFEHYEFQRAGDPQESTLTKRPLDRADFEAMYRGGYEYDPIGRAFRPRPGAMRAGGTGMIPRSGIGGVTHLVGAVPSEAVGMEVMRKLAAGEAEALRVVGVEAPEGFDPRTTEWGLGKRSDGSYVLVRGGRGEVNWDALPDVEPVSHAHPLRDPITGALRELVGSTSDRTISADLTDATQTDLVYFTPSSSDVEHVVRTGLAHVVHTPYVYLGGGRIGNPGPGVMGDTVDIVIDGAERVGMLSEDSPIVIYRARIRLMAGDMPISPGELELYQGMHPYMGDMPALRPPDTLFVLPLEVPATGPARTSAGEEGAGPSAGPAASTEIAQLRIDMAATLGIAPERVQWMVDFALDHVSVRPPSSPGGSYEIHAPPGATRAAIEAAIVRHVELARQRPADVRRDPNFTDDRGVRARWKGQFEAEYLGRPPADPGDYWALDRGKLKYVRGDAEVGSVRIYDEAQGILVPDTGKRGSVRFEAGTTKHEAFAILQDQPGFSEWASACEEFLGVGPDELIARMREPAGETYDRVRHGLKEDLTPQLVGKITERAFLKTRHPELYEGVADPSGRSVQDQIASHRELLRLTKGLGSADRGTIAEQWYAKMYASDAAKRHVRFTGKETEPNLVFGKGERVPDLIDGNQLKDIKHVSGALGKEVETQLADFRKLVDRKLNVGGTIYKLETLTVVFTEPSGVRANAEYMAKMLRMNHSIRDLQLARGAEGDRP